MSLAVSVVCAVSMLGLASPAQASARTTSHLRAALAPATVLVGSTAVVSGAVSPSLAGSPVVLQRLVSGHWVTLARKASGKHGVYSFTVRAKGKPTTWSLRVIRSSSAHATAVVGKTLKLRLTKTGYKVTSAAVSKVATGESITVAGTVGPKTTGKVYLQVLRGSKWVTLKAGTLSASKYSISMKLPAKTYALRVVKPFNAKIATGQSKPVKVTVYAPPAVAPKLALSSPDDATLALPGSRLVFSTVRSAPTPAKAYTFSNTGTSPLTVRGLAIQGIDANSFSFAPGQPTTLVIPPGGSATVNIVFTPTATTNCPSGTTYPADFFIGDATRIAGLVYTSTDPGRPGGSSPVAGLNSCRYSGVNEPVLDQVLSTLGYTDVVSVAPHDRRFLGQAAHLPGTDEINASYFTAANPALPVSLTPLSHYSSADVVPYHHAGWYAKGAALGPDSSCNPGNPACNPLWAFPGEATVNTFTDNQKLLPTPVGTTTFTPGGQFGLYLGEFTDVNFSDSSLNFAHGTDNKDLTPLQTLHDMRIYPAYGPDHVAIPNTYLVAVDVTRVPDFKNFDYQDVVLILRNAVPAS